MRFNLRIQTISFPRLSHYSKSLIAQVVLTNKIWTPSIQAMAFIDTSKGLPTESGAKNIRDLRHMRKPYRGEEQALVEESLPSRDPVQLFGIWFDNAKKCETILEINAVCVSTATKSGIPSSRMVLLKEFSADGFKFFTNLNSRKGQELAENPRAAMLFYWDPLNQQVRIEGRVEKLPDQESTDYFTHRPKASQIGAAGSHQSKPIESRQALLNRCKELEKEYANADHLPKPEEWGGYKVIPERFEFWQGQSNRVHDRIIFRRPTPEDKPDGKLLKVAQNGWLMERLQP